VATGMDQLLVASCHCPEYRGSAKPSFLHTQRMPIILPAFGMCYGVELNQFSNLAAGHFASRLLQLQSKGACAYLSSFRAGNAPMHMVKKDATPDDAQVGSH
jgi:hypothetical protein